ncbi:MAG: alpha/beta fold hydrolase [Sedimentisphaerales bacterium]|nr:alpha/beta fold hydrolase [Sedimentisphaerales bacterium]
MKRQRRKQPIRRCALIIARGLWVVVRCLFRIMTYRVIRLGEYRRPRFTATPRGAGELGPQNERSRRRAWLQSVIFWRLLRPVALRLLVLPPLLFVSLALIVCISVRTGRTEIRQFPDGMRLCYQPVEFHSEDGTLLRGWFIPSLKPEDVLREGDRLLRQQRPGVVLCHGLGTNRGQLLSLAAHLNQEGFEVLLFDFRGCGASDGQIHSFGLRERNDVLAAVHFLADRGSVDRNRIAVVGQDVGGFAALGASVRDYSIRALVLADVDRDMRTAIGRRLGESRFWCDWFTLAYLRGYQTYFRASERQLSAEGMAESLSETQRLLIIAPHNDASLKDSAGRIIKQSKAQAELLLIEELYPSTLMDASKVGPAIADFLRRSLAPPDAA